MTIAALATISIQNKRFIFMGQSKLGCDATIPAMVV